MPRIMVIPLVLIGFACAAATGDGGDTPRPGRWRSVWNVGVDTANGVKLQTPRSVHHVDTTCLKGTAGAGITLAEEGLPKECKIYQPYAAEGKISFTVICSANEDGLSLDAAGVGTYTGERISLRFHANGEMDGDQASMTITMVADRIGDCRSEK